jgi:hypothetical protein
LWIRKKILNTTSNASTSAVRSATPFTNSRPLKRRRRPPLRAVMTMRRTVAETHYQAKTWTRSRRRRATMMTQGVSPPHPLPPLTCFKSALPGQSASNLSFRPQSRTSRGVPSLSLPLPAPQPSRPQASRPATGAGSPNHARGGAGWQGERMVVVAGGGGVDCGGGVKAEDGIVWAGPPWHSERAASASPRRQYTGPLHGATRGPRGP